MNAPLACAAFASLVLLGPLAAAAEADDATVTGRQSEPRIQHIVTEDDAVRIEELRVRGQLVKATVHPKDGSPPYEIIVGDGSRELSTEGRNNSRGATGKRVWQVLSF